MCKVLFFLKKALCSFLAGDLIHVYHCYYYCYYYYYYCYYYYYYYYKKPSKSSSLKVSLILEVLVLKVSELVFYFQETWDRCTYTVNDQLSAQMFNQFSTFDPLKTSVNQRFSDVFRGTEVEHWLKMG